MPFQSARAAESAITELISGRPAPALPFTGTKISWSKNLPSFNAIYREQHRAGHPATYLILSVPSHPFHIKTVRRWEERFKNESNALWWSVGHATSKWKPVVSTSFKKRARRAFVEELKARNLDAACRPITKVGGKELPALIKGSLDIVVTNPDPATTRDQLRQQFGDLIDGLFKYISAHPMRKSGWKNERKRQSSAKDSTSAIG